MAVVECLTHHGLLEPLRANLTRLYAAFFQNKNLLGRFQAIPISFSDREALPNASAMAEVDIGRYLHLLFFTDTLVDELHETGLAGVNPSPAIYIDLLEERIRAAIDHAGQRPSYRGGISLLIHCESVVAYSFPFRN